MNKSNKSYEELLQELQELKAENASLKTAYNNDLSERKLTEEALSKSKEQLREILENSISVSYKRNLTTNKYDYISPAIFNILGYTSEEFKEFSIQNVLKIMYSEDITITNRQVTSNLGDVSKTNFNINYRLRHKKDRKSVV